MVCTVWRCRRPLASVRAAACHRRRSTYPIGRLLGALSPLPARIWPGPIAAALERAGITGDQVDAVILGNVIQVGVGPNPARLGAAADGICLTPRSSSGPQIHTGRHCCVVPSLGRPKHHHGASPAHTGQDAGRPGGHELPPGRRRPARRGTEPGSSQDPADRPLPHPVPRGPLVPPVAVTTGLERDRHTACSPVGQSVWRKNRSLPARNGLPYLPTPGTCTRQL